jgi:broad specificity phosphatase PhoE
MRIYLTRHAQSEWQLEPSENWDTSLTATGHQQAQQLARWLSTHPQIAGGTRIDIGSLYASPFKRAQETAAYVADALGLDVVTHKSLGEAEFHVASQLPQRDGPLAAFVPFTPSEKYAAFRAQADLALRVLVQQAETNNGAVLAVTHGGLIKTLLRVITATDVVCFRLYNTCLNVIEWRRGRWHLVHLNLWDHLPVELRTE